MNPDTNATLRAIPAVETLLHRPELDPVRGRLSHTHLVRVIRIVLEEARRRVLGGEVVEVGEVPLLQCVVRKAESLLGAGLIPVLNGTGVILHTNLGRAPLSARAIDAVRASASGYSNLEYNLGQGARGSRMSHVEELITFLTGGEAALVVNNNAAAVLLALNSLAEDRDVLVSRGELVEIGGSFRIPDVMLKSGARLCEVGTTNKTHLRDYAKAISDRTGLLLKVHTSNYRIEGFTAEVPLAELTALGDERGLPVMMDLGSGALMDVSRYGIGPEPPVSECLAGGTGLVTFSGDKLLGGPQAGLIVGRSDLVRKCRENPLARALRIDKLSLAALTATLTAYLDPDKVADEVPAIGMMAADPATVRSRALALAEKLNAIDPSRLSAEVLEAESAVGGGALPLEGLCTHVVALRASSLSPDTLETRLRLGTPPLLTRIQNGRVWIDLRTLSPEGETLVPDLVARALDPAPRN